MSKDKHNLDGRPSMHSVAAYAGVSIATVSKVMQGVASVRAENVVAVQNAIEALGYRINPLGAELRRGRRKLIGVIVPEFGAGASGRLLSHLERAIEARGYSLLVSSSRRSEAREADLVARMQDWRVAGVVFMPFRAERSAAALLLRDGPPTVFVGRIRGDWGFDAVGPDRLAAIGRQLSLAGNEGVKGILLIDGDASGQGSEIAALARKAGFEEAAVAIVPPGLPSKALVEALHALPRPRTILILDEDENRSVGELTGLSTSETDPLIAANSAAQLQVNYAELTELALSMLFRRMDEPNAGPQLTYAAAGFMPS